MNYYEHHLGDYMRDTAHLSILEDGVYRRLIDAYYIKESPLPSNIRECCRLVRAQSKLERQAVEDILNEFFKETPEGWSHKRCNEVIARFQDKQSKAKRSAEARWGASKNESDGNANAYANGMRTHSDGNAPNHQSQSPIKPTSPLINQGGTDGGEKQQSEHPKTAPTEPAHWVDYFNHHFGTAFGYKTQAQRKQIWPVLTAWCKRGITPEQINAAVSRALEDSTEPIANLILYTDRVLASSQAKKAPTVNWWSTEAGRKAKLEELGMSTRPGESNAALIARMTAEIERRAKG
jgi:uncharacterized protein YdaU (DUF1376 family)